MAGERRAGCAPNVSHDGGAMSFDEASIVAAIDEAVRSEAELPAEVARDVAFHMTDWLDDLSDWSAFCESPGSFTTEQVYDLLSRVLIHVPNHMNAAARLFTGLPMDDVFGIGATIGTGRPQG